ncbi:MAG TPA: YceI family protein, partial [Acidobacteriaceae bacterium]|nr:YceI family protein [Acidobacteriaceae bacterium]
MVLRSSWCVRVFPALCILAVAWSAVFTVGCSSSGSSSASTGGNGGSGGTTPPGPSIQVTTYHDDNMRSGQNTQETTLTTANVNTTSFGKVGFYPVDGKVDAEPLYLQNFSIAGATHNVLYVVTEHDSVYAFDADTGTALWHVSALGANETTSDPRNCGQVVPEIGITSTPVIDPNAGAHGTIYLSAMSKDSSGNYHQRLHALDLTTGAEQSGSPVDVQATYPGSGAGSSNGQVNFDPGQYDERAGLLLLNGVVYLAWTSHCDIQPWIDFVTEIAPEGPNGKALDHQLKLVVITSIDSRIPASIVVRKGELPMPPILYAIDPAHSSVHFSVRHLMVSNVRGEFAKISGTVKYDPEKPETSTVEATIDATSISTRDAQRDAHLKSADFLDVEKFPALTFRSKKIEVAAGGGKVTGDLTIHGVTREITLDVEGPTAEMKDPWGKQRIGASATAKLNRKDFGLTWNAALEAGGVMVGDEVKIT